MPVTLNHTIVHAHDPADTARFIVDMFGLEPFKRLGPFIVVQAGPTSLDFLPAEGAISSRHFAFLVSEAEFDAVMGRLHARRLEYWADPYKHQPADINHWDDGRGVYFDEPSGHLLEALTRPYGSGGLGARNVNPLLLD